MGIPARIDEVTGKVQLMKEEGALDVDLDCKDTVSVSYTHLDVYKRQTSI